jgi:hypothetical protein
VPETLADAFINILSEFHDKIKGPPESGSGGIGMATNLNSKKVGTDQPFSDLGYSYKVYLRDSNSDIASYIV